MKVTKNKLLSTENEPGVYSVQRAWGAEYWIANSDLYCGKVLRIVKGKGTSMHFHLNKTETMMLDTGKVTLQMIDPDDGSRYDVELEPGDSITIPRGQPHRIMAIEESFVTEFSTKHEETDSYRVAPRIA